MVLNESLKSWAAGYFDGGVMMKIYFYGSVIPRLQKKAVFENVDYVKVLEQFGGNTSIEYNDNRLTGDAEQPYLKWKLQGEKACKLVSTLQPYMNVKQLEAYYFNALLPAYRSRDKQAKDSIAEDYLNDGRFQDETFLLRQPLKHWSLQYLAGLFDSSGYTTQRSGRFGLFVSNMNIIDVLTGTYGGTYYEHPPRTRTDLSVNPSIQGVKTHHEWVMSKRNSVSSPDRFLKDIQPYSQILEVRQKISTALNLC